MLVRRDALDALGGLDEGFFLYAEDTDLCARLWDAGLRGALRARDAAWSTRGGHSAPRSGLRTADVRSHVRYVLKHEGCAPRGWRRWHRAGGGHAPRRRASPAWLRPGHRAGLKAALRRAPGHRAAALRPAAVAGRRRRSAGRRGAGASQAVRRAVRL